MQPSANMKPRAELHQSAPSAISARDVEAGDHAPAGAEPHRRPQADTDQAVVREQQALAQRRADMVDEFERRRAGAALRAVDHDEVRMDAGLDHGLADRHELPRMADAELEADRLAARKLAQLRDEVHQLDRSRERGMARAARCSRRRPARRAPRRFQRSPWAPGSTPPWPGLAPCDSLISIILTCGSCACAAKRSAQKLPSSLRQPK